MKLHVLNSRPRLKLHFLPRFNFSCCTHQSFFKLFHPSPTTCLYYLSKFPIFWFPLSIFSRLLKFPYCVVLKLPRSNFFPVVTEKVICWIWLNFQSVSATFIFLFSFLFGPEDGAKYSCETSETLQAVWHYNHRTLLFKEIIVYWLLQRLSVWFTKDLKLLEKFLAFDSSPPCCTFFIQRQQNAGFQYHKAVCSISSIWGFMINTECNRHHRV